MSLLNPRTWLWRRLLRNAAITSLAIVSVVLLVHIAWTWMESRALAAELARCEAAGVPIRIAQALPKEIPTEQNAAVDYAEAYRLITADSQRPWLRDGKNWATLNPDLDELLKMKDARRANEYGKIWDLKEWTPARKNQVRAVLARYEPAWEAVTRGSHKPSCHATHVEWEKGMYALMGQADLNGWIARLLELRALLANENGDQMAITRDIAVRLRQGRHQQQEGLQYLHYWGSTLRSMALLRLQRQLTDPGNPGLGDQELAAALESQDVGAYRLQVADLEATADGGWIYDQLNHCGRAQRVSYAEVRLSSDSLYPNEYLMLWLWCSPLGTPFRLREETCYWAGIRKQRAELQAGQPVNREEPYISAWGASPAQNWNSLCWLESKMLRDSQYEELARTALAVAAHFRRTGNYPDAAALAGLKPADIHCSVGESGVVLTVKSPAIRSWEKPSKYPLLRWVVGREAMGAEP